MRESLPPHQKALCVMETLSRTNSVAAVHSRLSTHVGIPAIQLFGHAAKAPDLRPARIVTNSLAAQTSYLQQRRVLPEQVAVMETMAEAALHPVEVCFQYLT
jgi:hypothetical protein